MGEPEQSSTCGGRHLVAAASRSARPRRRRIRCEEEAVAVDRSGQRLRLAAERVDDVAIVDTVQADAVAAAAQARMAEDMGGAEPCLDPIVVDVDAQALADQPQGAL